MTLAAPATVARVGCWLPGLRDDDVAAWQDLTFGLPDAPLTVRVPRLTATGLANQQERLVAARDAYLAEMPLARIIERLDRVASRWLDPSSPYRREAEQWLPAITGYAEAAIRKGLSSFLAGWRAENLWRFVESELQDPAALDGFVGRGAGGGETRAFGPRLTVHVWSGNVPGLAAQSLATALLAKSASLGKVASEEPLFPTLLAESIAEVDPNLSECLAVAWWPGGDAELEPVAFGAAEAVIAYGSETAVQAVRKRTSSGARFVAHGHKLSFGAIGREALTLDRLAETADRAAYDVAKYDQQGCLSPHLFYVERGETDPRTFADALAVALTRYGEQVPRGRLSFGEAAGIRMARERHELRALIGEPVALLSGQGWTVLYDEDAIFEASCLNRTVAVKPIDDLLVDIPRLAAPVRVYLQTCGVAASSERCRDLAGLLGRLGLDRVCPLGRMADVAPTWHHDGRCSLLDLLRWTDIEPDASAGRWEFAHPDLGLYGLAPASLEEEEGGDAHGRSD